MSKLPLLSWRDVVKVLTKEGFHVVRQRGSHVILVKEEYIVPVPKHREIKRGLLLEIMAEAGLAREEFLKLLKEI
ncbi:MAG: type II toxin-antitoxin system HicA family toxin [archaeon]|nr:type II toxin-antitoxin system HicA family toxin [archaeon]